MIVDASIVLPRETGGSEMAVDPVCGMEVDPSKAAAEYTHEGKTYYFCADACRQKFAKEPGRFLKGAGEGWAPLTPKEGLLSKVKKLFSSG
jgi:Cu+-exporting ATPase